MSERKARLMDSARKALSSLSHYDYEECEVGYMFSTEIGNVYLVTFTEYPLISDLVETTLYMLNIDRLNRVKSSNADGEKVRNTILIIIYKFFEKNTDALVTICESGDSRQKVRHRLFSQWFEMFNNGYLHKKDAVFIADGAENYASLYYRENTVDRHLLLAGFDDLVNAKFYLE